MIIIKDHADDFPSTGTRLVYLIQYNAEPSSLFYSLAFSLFGVSASSFRACSFSVSVLLSPSCLFNETSLRLSFCLPVFCRPLASIFQVLTTVCPPYNAPRYNADSGITRSTVTPEI